MQKWQYYADPKPKDLRFFSSDLNRTKSNFHFLCVLALNFLEFDGYKAGVTHCHPERSEGSQL
jgi:hypothetical protein